MPADSADSLAIFTSRSHFKDDRKHKISLNDKTKKEEKKKEMRNGPVSWPIRVWLDERDRTSTKRVLTLENIVFVDDLNA